MLQRKEKMLDPILLAVMGARMGAIVEEMTLSMMYTARSAILNVCRDFSCSLLTSDARLLSLYEGVPIHVTGAEYNIRPILEFFRGQIEPGDVFLNNCPYTGNTHHADYSLSAPVFYKGELLFWALCVGHQNDCGVHVPDTYCPYCKDIYEEGPHFPCIRIQRNYKNLEDIIRIFRMNIRYPDQWYGDYLAQVGALRCAERALVDFCDKYGVGLVKEFIEEWMNYSERKTKEMIRKFPRGTWYDEAHVDPTEFAPEGIPIRVKLTCDPDQGIITIDLTESADQAPNGLNCTESTAVGGAYCGVLPCLDPTIPINHGLYKCIKVVLREGCVAGIPKFPASTANATLAVPKRIAGSIFRIFAEIDASFGHSEGAQSSHASGTITGFDYRRGYRPYGHQLCLLAGGGPASMHYDGWPSWLGDISMGVMPIESVELHEARFPHLIKEIAVSCDSAGAGQWRSGLGGCLRLQPIKTGVTLACRMEGVMYPARGVMSGRNAIPNRSWIEDANTGGEKRDLAAQGPFHLDENEVWVTYVQGGGGFGIALDRNPELVRWDARNEYISLDAAKEVYGVVLKADTELYDVDYQATTSLREKLRKKMGE